MVLEFIYFWAANFKSVDIFMIRMTFISQKWPNWPNFEISDMGLNFNVYEVTDFKFSSAFTF